MRLPRYDFYMDESTPSHSSETLIELQRTVQRKLGRCLLRLQQYEIQLKFLVAHSDIAGPPDKLQARQDDKLTCTQKKTMGTLVGMLTESYLTSSQAEESTEDEVNASSGGWFRFRSQMVLDAEQYNATKLALKELVDLRNELVHHFLMRFDIWQADGCAAADSYLDESYETIDRHFLILHEWVKSMDNVRAMILSLMETSVFKDMFINGIHPEGSVVWPISGIVRYLFEAESKLAQAGWTELNAAIAWIRQHAPEQIPKRYGCNSWRQVIHESGQFEIRKQTADGGTVVSYRSFPYL